MKPIQSKLLVLLVILIGFTFLAVGLALGSHLPLGTCDNLAPCFAGLPLP
ncbi:MAG: hypothetical protein LUQ65_11155 [Candidatus Helarchaeota archaeon]|nr:hypothetical protein [Candidatus Helarchaeota archaeon]